MCPVVLIIFVPERGPYSGTVSGLEGFRSCYEGVTFCKMPQHGVLGRASDTATMSSYKGLNVFR